MSKLLRRATLALAAAGAIVAGTASTASAHGSVYVTRYYRPAPVYVAPRVYAAPIVPYVAPIYAPARVYAPAPVIVVRRYHRPWW